MEKQIKIVQDAREEYYGDNGLLSNAYYGNMASSPGGVFQEGMTEPNLFYKKLFKDMYQEETVIVDEQDTDSNDNYDLSDVIDIIDKSDLTGTSKRNLVNVLDSVSADTDEETIYNFIDYLIEKESTTSSDKIRVNIKNIRESLEKMVYGDYENGEGFDEDSDANNAKNEKDSRESCK